MNKLRDLASSLSRQKKKLVNVFEQNMMAEKAEQERIEAMRVKPKAGAGQKLVVPQPEEVQIEH